MPNGDNLITADQLPALPKDGGAGPWREVPSQQAPTLVCQGAWLSSLNAETTLNREFRSTSTPSDTEVGAVNVTVLEFADRTDADAAYETVRGWLEDCPASLHDGGATVTEAAQDVEIATSPDVAKVDRAAQVLATYAPDVCDPGCEASWWDHQTVAQIGKRLVLVSEAEYAGACGPITGDELDCEDESLKQPWLDRVDQTVERAVGRGIWDLH